MKNKCQDCIHCESTYKLICGIDENRPACIDFESRYAFREAKP